MSGLVDKLKGHKALVQGAKIPAGAPVKQKSPEDADLHLDQLVGTNIIVGVPGAFTPPCSSQVPGYIADAGKFREKGVAGIYIVAVNDLFTVNAWKEKLGADPSSIVHFVADDTGAFTKHAGLGFDASGLLGGFRSQRYVAVLNGPTVSQIYIEDKAPDVTVTKSENVLQAIKTPV